MTSISLRMSDNLLHDLDDNARLLEMSRTDYIKEAIKEMNMKIREDDRRKRLMKLSKLVRDESLKINQEFSEIENDPEY